MANFVMKGKRISKETISALKNRPLTIGLWGPLNTYVNPPKELEVVVNSSSGAATAEPSKKPITGNIREWVIKGTVAGTVKIEAKAGAEVWDSFDLDILPAAYVNILPFPEKPKFIKDLAHEGSANAKKFGFPLSAMLACACCESGFGTSPIFKRTRNPFNLQKPQKWEYPKCTTEVNDTVNKEGEHSKPSPFCIATSLSDAVREFCEWIDHYPDAAKRQLMRSLANNPKEFAVNLYQVAFANSKKDRTTEYGVVWKDYELGRFD